MRCLREYSQLHLCRPDPGCNPPLPPPACDPSQPVDSDDDGVSDCCDNCPEVCNPEQVDLSDDGYGDVCREDCDSNGLDDRFELAIGGLTDGSDEPCDPATETCDPRTPNGLPDECECPSYPGQCACPQQEACNSPCTASTTNCTYTPTFDSQCLIGSNLAECDLNETFWIKTCACNGPPPPPWGGPVEPINCGESVTIHCFPG